MTRLVAAALVLVALLAPMLAAANVPDPTWIPGMYDGGDADEILALVWDETPAIAAILQTRDEALERLKHASLQGISPVTQIGCH